MNDDLELYKRRMEREKRARLQAEKIAEEKSRELYLKGLELEKSFAVLGKTKREIEVLLNALEAFTSTLEPSAIVDHLRRFIGVELPDFSSTISVVADGTAAPGVNFRLDTEGLRVIEAGGEIRFRKTRLRAAELKVSSMVLTEADSDILQELESPAPTLLIPLVAHGTMIGFLAVHGLREKLDAENIRFLQALANEAAVSLQNALLFREVDRLSRIDPLTGIMNRRSFNITAERFIQLAIRHHKILSTAMLDIDFFKKVNDSYGHAAGDDVLKEVARVCEGLLRRSDIVGRFGGEEFCFLFPETGIEGARNSAERIRLAVSELEFASDEKRFQVTASIGLSELRGEADSLEMLLSRSDEALYRAKESGRNRVEAWA